MISVRLVQLDQQGKEALEKEFKDLIRGGGNSTPAPSQPMIPTPAQA